MENSTSIATHSKPSGIPLPPWYTIVSLGIKAGTYDTPTGKISESFCFKKELMELNIKLAFKKEIGDM